MRETKLQRLLAPGGVNLGGIGVFNGYSKEVVNELLKITTFDYMGSSKYELGAIPNSLSHIAKNKDSMPLVEQTICGVDFYLIVKNTELTGYAAKIEFWINNSNHDSGNKYHGLQDISKGENSRNIVGWLDLDEHVLFFLKTTEGAVMADRFEKIFNTPKV